MASDGARRPARRARAFALGLRGHPVAAGQLRLDQVGGVGVTRQIIIAIEQGRYSPAMEAAFKIAWVFEVGPEEVFPYQG